ncbi:MAG: energy transducer TonB [Wenzhouxiangella sp.]|nr:energy transducer TonB [Wenzhouxiangella sp.]
MNKLFAIFALPLLAVLAGCPTASAADPGARFSQLQQALDGDSQAIAALGLGDHETGLYHFVRAAAYQRRGHVDEAVEAYLDAIRLGDDLAILALAEMLADNERYVDALAWSQVWVLNRFELAEIHQGKARRDPGMAVLQRALERLNDAEIARAEQHAAEVLNDWLPDFERQQTVCIQPSQYCSSWRLTRRRAPVFPYQMGHQGESGWTRHALLVGPDGRVTDIVTVHSTNDAATRSAERALRRWRFESSADKPGSAIFQQTVLFGRW